MIPLKEKKREALLPTDDIVAVSADRDYSFVHTAREEQPWYVRRTLAQWTEMLPANEFVRIDRSLIISTLALRSMERISRSKTLLFLRGCETPFTIGRAATTRVKSLIHHEFN